MKKILQIVFCAFVLLLQTNSQAMEKQLAREIKELEAKIESAGFLQKKGFETQLAQKRAELEDLQKTTKRGKGKKKGKRRETPPPSETEESESEEEEIERKGTLDTNAIVRLADEIGNLRVQINNELARVYNDEGLLTKQDALKVWNGVGLGQFKGKQ